MRLALFAATSAFLVGCVSTGPARQTINVNEPFDAAVAMEMIADGDGRLNGAAFLRQQGGGVVTCAGNQVRLLPATGYALERMAGIYGNPFSLGEVKYVGVYSPRVNAVVLPDPDEYSRISRSTTCDAQGNFEFQGIKDGRYFVATHVVWRVRSEEGGALASLISVKNGKAAKVIMSK